MIKIEWADFKSMLDSSQISLKWIESEGAYSLYGYDGNFVCECLLNTSYSSQSDIDDFVNNYKDNYTNVIKDRDPTGREIIRSAATIKGYHYQSREIEVDCSKLDGAKSYKWDHSLATDVSCKIYDSNGAEITDQANEGNAVRTQFIFSPNHDYEILGGNLRQSVRPANDVRVSAIGGAVDLGINYSKEFIPSINMKYVAPETILQSDGRASKFMALDTGGLATNKFEVNVYYTQGDTHSFVMSFELFKE